MWGWGFQVAGCRKGKRRKEQRGNFRGKGTVKERNKTKPRGGGDQGPLLRGPHHLRAPGASTQTASPRVGPKRGPGAPIPLPRPGSLTCEHREQNQLWKQEPWTAGQPSCVHPSRWPEVARQASRTDRQRGAAGSDGRARNGKGMEGMEGTEGGQMEPAVLPGVGSRRDLAIAREPWRGARGAAPGRAGAEVSLSLPAGPWRRARGTIVCPGPPGFTFHRRRWHRRGLGAEVARLLPTPQFFLLQ